MSTSRRRPTEDLSDLASRIEAELSGGSRESLRRLLAQLSPAQDNEDDPQYQDDEEGDFESWADRYRPWDDRPWGDRPGDDGDEDLEGGLEGSQEPGPYWWRQRSASPRVPVPVEGGLLARSQRGPIGETWWSQRFLAAVDTALVGGRSSRGRSYARKGQVIELWVAPGVIRGTVQGTRRTPYDVCIVMPAADDAQWARILASLAAQALYSASMLAGELPHEIEEVFAGVGAHCSRPRPLGFPAAARAPTGPTRASMWPRWPISWPSSSIVTRSSSWRGGAASGARSSGGCESSEV